MDGIINVYKEKGYTSFDVVAKVRGIVGQRRVGHTGTLDPEAEGVLLVCVGSATKACELLTDKDKTYEAVMLLGVETDTQDLTGKILRQCKAEVSEEQVRDAVMSFLGTYDQVPPMYSALKVGGKRLYELARQGTVIERAPRPVTIYSIEIKELSLPRVRFFVTCSKGTYIRALCEDIGKKLGCGGCMESLRRVKVSDFSVEDSLTLEKLSSMREGGEISKAVFPVERLFLQYPLLKTTSEGDRWLYNGNQLPIWAFANLSSVKENWEETKHPTEEKQTFTVMQKQKKEQIYKSSNNIKQEDIILTDKNWYRVYDSYGQFYALYQYNRSTDNFCNIKMFIPEKAKM